MKKLTLILILFLTFTLIGNTADLFGTYDQRIKLTIDETKIDDTGDLTWFPVTVFLTSSQGEEVFVEFDADADYKKVAFTKADGVTELYAECELFDDSAEKAIYHVSRDGWVIDDTADTDFYMYYDNDAGDNNTYIGAITARTEVWDGNFKLVYHMVDDNGNVDDSTSNNNDGTKLGAGQPEEAAGKVGQGQDFDGDNDKITRANFTNTAPLTVTAIVNITKDGSWLINKRDGDIDDQWQLINWDGYLLTQIYDGEDFIGTVSDGTTCVDAGYVHIGFTTTGVTDGALILYRNGASNGTPTTLTGNMKLGARDLVIGQAGYTAAWPTEGIMDEIRLSDSIRSATWLKGTYNSLFDTLLTYRSAVNALFFGANF